MPDVRLPRGIHTQSTALFARNAAEVSSRQCTDLCMESISFGLHTTRFGGEHWFKRLLPSFYCGLF